MATEKNVETGKNLETQKDVDTTKATATGEPSIEYLVDGLTEEQLKGVSGGLLGTAQTAQTLDCKGVACLGLTSQCVAYCGTMDCKSVTCSAHRCSNFTMPA